MILFARVIGVVLGASLDGVILIEENVEEIVRISVIPHPAAEAHGVFQVVELGKIGSPIEGNEAHLDSHPGEIPLNHLGHMFAVGHIGA